MNFPAGITFKAGDQPQDFNFHQSGMGEHFYWPHPGDHQFIGRTWRYLADDCAVVLRPLCDAQARLLSSPPQCDRLEIWPVRMGYPEGYPESLVKKHPTEVKKMLEEHRAGKFGLSITFQQWLERFGVPLLWDFERDWLAPLNGPGHLLSLHAGAGESYIRRSVLPGIQFRADFYQGNNKPVTIWLAGCVKTSLTLEEMKLSPAHIAREEKRLRKEGELIAANEKLLAKQSAVEAAKAKNLAAARRASQMEAKRTLPWHSADFRVIWRPGAKDDYTLDNTFCALCQLLSEQPERRARFGQIETLLGDRIRELEKKEGRSQDDLSPKAKKQLREILKRPEAKKLILWGILKVQETGREKFLILSPPKPAK